jgi:O-antigen ligase
MENNNPDTISRDFERIPTSNVLMNNSQSVTDSNLFLKAICIFFISWIFVMLGWAVAFIYEESFLFDLKSVSDKLKYIDLYSPEFIATMMTVIILGLILNIYLFVKFFNLFLILAVISFAVAEAQLRILNYFSLFERYLLDFSLFGAGIVGLIFAKKRYKNIPGLFGLIYCFLIIVSLSLHGIDGKSAMMLPMQLALMIGIFWGLESEICDLDDIKRICVLLGWLGAAFTIFHVSALFLAAKPFLNGRFRSFFVLPTNFADRYALLFVALVWLSLIEKKILFKFILWGLVLVGALLIIISGTRNAAMMVFISVCVFSLIWKIKIPALIFVISAIIFVVMVGIAENTWQISSTAERITNIDAKNRYEVWSLAWKYISLNPLYGYGLGKTGKIMTEGLDKWEAATFIDAHNAYMGIWIQLGIFGVLLIIFIFAYAIYKGFKHIAGRSADAWRKKIMVLPLANVCSLFLGGMFEENLTSRGSLPQLMLGISIILIMGLSKKSEISFSSKLPIKN